MIGWEEQVRVRPRLFTTAAWATLSQQQRDVVRRQRMAVVAALADDHDRRYHCDARLHTLTLAVHAVPDLPDTTDT